MTSDYYKIPHFYYGVHLNLCETSLLLLHIEPKFTSVAENNYEEFWDIHEKEYYDFENGKEIIEYYKKAYSNITKYIEIINKKENYDEEDYNDDNNEINESTDLLENDIHKFIKWYIIQYSSDNNHDNPEEHDKFDFYDCGNIEKININGNRLLLQKDDNMYMVYLLLSLPLNLGDNSYYSFNELFGYIDYNKNNHGFICTDMKSLPLKFEFLKNITEKKPGILVKYQEICGIET
jgi:hypothetical protein